MSGLRAGVGERKPLLIGLRSRRSGTPVASGLSVPKVLPLDERSRDQARECFYRQLALRRRRAQIAARRALAEP